MEYLRYIFLVAILTGSTSIGFLLSKIHKERVYELNSFANLINILQNKIKFTQKPLPEIFEEISNINAKSSISIIFKKAAEKIKYKRIEDSWNDAIQEQKFFLNLKSEDISLIKTLGNVLGKTGVEGQMSEIAQFMGLLKIQIKNAEEEKRKNEKLYKSLGTIIGLAIVIIFF